MGEVSIERSGSSHFQKQITGFVLQLFILEQLDKVDIDA
jgi:hypothetical protein